MSVRIKRHGSRRGDTSRRMCPLGYRFFVFGLLMIIGVSPLMTRKYANAFPAPLFAEVQTESIQRQISEEDVPGHEFRATAGSFRLMTRVGLEPLSFWRIYLIGGVGDLNVPDFDLYQANAGFLYGAGMGWNTRRAFAGRVTGWRTFGDVTIFTHATEDDVITIHGQEHEKITWLEYGLRGGVSYALGGIEPFAGVRLSEVQGTDRLSETGRLTFESKKNIGLFGGVSVPFYQTSSIWVELSALDEMAIRVILCLTPPRFPSF